jgi:DNA polymerase III epsilon subunit-like protein
LYHFNKICFTYRREVLEKIFWFDCETTGINPEPVYTQAGEKIQSGMIQMAGMIEIDGQIKHEFCWKLRPASCHHIDSGALAVSGETTESIMAQDRDSQEAAYRALSVIFKNSVSQYDRDDKLILAGYNVAFDDRFLRQMFVDFCDKYYGSYIFWPKRDISYLVAEEIARGNRFRDCKLATLCEAYGIEIDAHDALSDIRATRDLYMRLTAH